MFAYPINRGKLLISKVVIVFVFTILTMLISIGLAFGIFFFTESRFPLVAGDAISPELIISTLQIALVFSILAGAIGLISLWFGLKRKSVQATLILSYIMAAVGSNILGVPMLLGSANMAMLTVMSVTALLIGIILTINLVHSVNRMEAE